MQDVQTKVKITTTAAFAIGDYYPAGADPSTAEGVVHTLVPLQIALKQVGSFSITDTEKEPCAAYGAISFGRFGNQSHQNMLEARWALINDKKINVMKWTQTGNQVQSIASRQIFYTTGGSAASPRFYSRYHPSAWVLEGGNYSSSWGTTFTGIHTRCTKVVINK